MAYLNSVKATYNSSEKRKKPQLLLRLMLCRHRLIFPGRFQPSIVSTDELNYRVRDGNGWTLIAKNTDYRCAFNALVSFNVGYYTTTKSVCQYFFESFFEKIFTALFQAQRDSDPSRKYRCEFLLRVSFPLCCLKQQNSQYASLRSFPLP